MAHCCEERHKATEDLLVALRWLVRLGSGQEPRKPAAFAGTVFVHVGEELRAACAFAREAMAAVEGNTDEKIVPRRGD